MLIVRQAQVDAFQEDDLQQFAQEMVLHLQDFAGPWSATMGDEKLMAFVRQGIERAETYAFTLRGPIRLVLELLVIFGAGLDADPQYPWIGETLRRTDFQNQMFRAGRLEYLAIQYLNKVHGTKNEMGHQALFRLEERLAKREGESSLHFSRDSLPKDIVAMFSRIFPAKLDHVGEAAARAVIADADVLCHQVFGDGHERAVALVATLKFSFGMRCEDDSAYPWIGRTLRNPRLTDPRARSAGLERQALAWLKAVNGRVRAAGEYVEGEVRSYV